jgi:hypothetical protein
MFVHSMGGMDPFLHRPYIGKERRKTQQGRAGLGSIKYRIPGSLSRSVCECRQINSPGYLHDSPGSFAARIQGDRLSVPCPTDPVPLAADLGANRHLSGTP